MTVADLIELLYEMPPDLPVLTLVDEFEGATAPKVALVNDLRAEEYVSGPDGFNGPCVLVSYD